MNDENTKRIIDACPSLFASMSDEVDNLSEGRFFTPIAFGFECGDGWADLLVELCEKIQIRLNELPNDVAKEYVAMQVKEKYGTLRFYTSYCDDAIDALIAEAERKSACTCEQCGAPGKVRGSVWYYTACDKHTRDVDLNPVPESEMP